MSLVSLGKTPTLRRFLMTLLLPQSDWREIVDAFSRSQAIIQFKPDGTILEANENFLRTFGYSLDEIKGRHHRMFVDSEYANTPEYERLWKALAKGSINQLNSPGLPREARKSGSRQHIILSSAGRGLFGRSSRLRPI